MQTVALIIPEILPEKTKEHGRSNAEIGTAIWGAGRCTAQELVFQAETQKYVFTKMKRSKKKCPQELTAVNKHWGTLETHRLYSQGAYISIGLINITVCKNKK